MPDRSRASTTSLTKAPGRLPATTFWYIASVMCTSVGEIVGMAEIMAIASGAEVLCQVPEGLRADQIRIDLAGSPQVIVKHSMSRNRRFAKLAIARQSMPMRLIQQEARQGGIERFATQRSRD